MKTIIKRLSTSILVLAVAINSICCDNNDDVQSSPQDGFTVNSVFHGTENAYIAIDQFDRDTNGKADYYTFFFTDGRITDTYGDQGLGYAHNFSTNITNLVKLQIFEGASNPNLTNTITVGETYVASSVLTTSLNGFGVTNSGYSKDSFISYGLQQGTPIFGNENGFDFTSNPLETGGIWHYAGTTGPTITINAINIDTTTPSNSTINVDYTFLDTNGNTITGHYEGLLGIILD
jgi:hypothetical protein